MGYFSKENYDSGMNLFFSKTDVRFMKNKTKYPVSITLETLDKEFVKWFESKNIVIGSRVVPIVFLLSERWAIFKKNWKLMDADKNIEYPLIAVKRGQVENQRDKINIPGQKFITYIEPTLVGAGPTHKHYRMKQPTKLNVSYEIHIISNYISDDNLIVETLLNLFSSSEAGINYYGHYMPLMLNGINDETNYDAADAERIIHKSTTIDLKGYLIDEKDFEEKTGIASILVDIHEDV